ncbi:hypothetical protein [Sphingomonas montanisoli]|uniref:DUF4189 domain-containing protein n=1 Tax=Sphingomonas montanisoli TaxID=2606412 RepID=A0A5D9C4V6_9SPHN|nr:hypothetical protein [Sphingomonas montanisoli]TZG26247.1 hypothetical protein FYJ91_14995 [Sphingomonas montanisoli]
MKMVRAFAPALLIALSLPALTAPAAAQRSERVLVIYGSDKCPTSGGEEIVVCSRKPESERYRIPEELRKSDSRANETWGDRASSLEYVGKTGVTSCSPIGPGGANGCVRELARKACDEDKADGKKCGIKF